METTTLMMPGYATYHQDYANIRDALNRTGANSAFSAPFYTKSRPLTKTGSGQT
jgi:hypothetical protein